MTKHRKFRTTTCAYNYKTCGLKICFGARMLTEVSTSVSVFMLTQCLWNRIHFSFCILGIDASAQTGCQEMTIPNDVSAFEIEENHNLSGNLPNQIWVSVRVTDFVVQELSMFPNPELSSLLCRSLLGVSLDAREPRSVRSGKCQALRSRLQIQWMDAPIVRLPSQAHLPASAWQSTSSTQGETITRVTCVLAPIR